MHIDNFVSGYNKFRIISHGLINELLYCSSFDFHATFLIRQNQSGLKAPTIAYFEQNKYLIYILFFLRSRIKLTFRTVSVCEAILILCTYLPTPMKKKKYFIIRIPNISFKFYVIIKQKKNA